jgi:hypothetical protein
LRDDDFFDNECNGLIAKTMAVCAGVRGTDTTFISSGN